MPQVYNSMPYQVVKSLLENSNCRPDTFAYPASKTPLFMAVLRIAALRPWMCSQLLDLQNLHDQHGSSARSSGSKGSNSFLVATGTTCVDSMHLAYAD